MTDNSDRLWLNPKHWKWHFFYVCHQDPRIVVPERHKWMGWTFNFGHRSAFLLLAVLALGLIVPSLDAVLSGQIQKLPLTLSFSLIFTVVLIFVVSRVGRN